MLRRCGTFTKSADKLEFTPYAHYYGGALVPDPIIVFALH
jgi:hypothetical protein